MTIYYLEKKDDGTTSIFSGEMSDRAKFWLEHPKAKEISRKEYNQWVRYINGEENKRTLLIPNK